ncbi:cationic amino acid transporter 1-like [Macadamia integrifolia]|uniref:cationic amino acid transporter 1-like n=1 Tax=Macadamia integrifolia TaxID=60698 RepID=UPI001C52920D|nr:cationic amino acid transporter 1-like [Macadamia integrifolia]XP_042520418.1 cationic amino acid transporter 1-like [Macadamia integrifolia]
MALQLLKLPWWEELQALQILQLLLLFIPSLFIILKFARQAEKSNLPPSPPKLTLIGNLHQLGTLPYRSLRDLSYKYGPLMFMQLGSSRTLVVSSAEILEEITKSRDIVFSNRTRMAAGEKLFYGWSDLAFAPYSEYWRQVRKFCVLELLSVKRVQSFKFDREEVVGIMIEKINHSSQIENPVNISDLLLITSNNLISRIALGGKYHGEDNNESKVWAEETKNPGRDIPIGLVGSMTITTFAYCLMAATLCLMQPYDQIDPDAPFSIAFKATGMDWAKYIVALGALKGMTSVLLVSAMGQARYLTHIARTHMAPPCLGYVNEKFGTPINATIVMLVATAVIALFTDLNILANLLSISTLFIFMLVAIALLIRRYYVSGISSLRHQIFFITFILVILASSAAIAVCWAIEVASWIPFLLTLIVWFLSTLGLRLFVPQARNPKLWGVPLVPWLPSASIAINIFLLGSIDAKSYMRFAVWTGGLLVYYLFFGLHASYDAARESSDKRAEAAKQLQKMEEGSTNSQMGADMNTCG